MEMNASFSVIGGDLRLAYLAKSLANDGFSVKCFGVDQSIDISPAILCTSLQKTVENTENVILPLPVTRDGIHTFALAEKEYIRLSDVLECVTPSQRLFGGKIPAPMKQEAITAGICVFDYFEREELTVLNAIPTAEGALQIAMEKMPTTINGSNCLITGNGRISRMLSRILHALGAHVTIAARRPSDLAWATAGGCRAIHIQDISREISRYDVIFNTVPALILYNYILKKVRKDSWIIDLASAPGGLDFNAAEELELNVVWAASLPGKVAPLTAGSIIKDTILNIIEEDKTCPE